MEAETLRALETSCPLRLTMNNGETFAVERPEFIMVSDDEATVMVPRKGKLRNVTLSLINITSAGPIGAAN